MSRKRKSAPPRRLDSVAREEHNWEAGKEDRDEAVLLQPPAPAINDEYAQLLNVEHEKDKDKEVVLIEDEPEAGPSNAKPKSVLELLSSQLQSFEESLENPTPRARKKPKQVVPPTYIIPFNSTTIDTSGYVEIKTFVVDCDAHNEKYFEDIQQATHHLYTRLVPSESTCDFVTTTGDIMATSELPLPQQVVSSLTALQKKGKAYLDAFPIKAPVNRILRSL